MKGCKVIVCGPAIGKTYLAKHDDRFVDLDGERAKYKYDLFDATDYELEAGKFNRQEPVRKNVSDYVIKRLNEEIEKGKVVLLSFHEKVLDYLMKNNIDYCLVYAGLDLAREYRERMRARGNCKQFIEELANDEIWEKFYFEHINDTNPTYKIELKSGQYLSDIADKFF